jgi:hypothetical protein
MALEKGVVLEAFKFYSRRLQMIKVDNDEENGFMLIK